MLLRIVMAVVSLSSAVDGHGMLLNPAGRSSMWRLGYDVNPNYSDNELNCGGLGMQWDTNGGKCGACGDAYGGPYLNQPPYGIYVPKIAARRYQRGDVIKVHIRLTTNHKGHFEFRICPNDNFNRRVTQECLDRHPLSLADGTGTRWHIPMYTPWSHNFTVLLKLPEDVVCEKQCVLQWKYTAGNNWDYDFETGEGCSGCGKQETFINCADVAITDSKQWSQFQSQMSDPNSKSGCVGIPRLGQRDTAGSWLFCRDQCTVDSCDTRYCMCASVSERLKDELYDTCHPWPTEPFLYQRGTAHSVQYCKNHCWSRYGCREHNQWCVCREKVFPGYYTTTTTPAPTTPAEPDCYKAVGLPTFKSPLADYWCQINCSNIPSYCPDAFCKCLDKNEKLLNKK
ncbi:uncharacterized protein LOC106170437 [Lingula anatina]|uniref:Uncharacterized protein LOC106170437 n=1 Tax=Lingula anatina TaxID=7574 RepID=A0A1S3J5Q3_LINAN|nr:uncharacterized protein LOC106170437 [Lingula anatina]|eukprot:XP_013405752.1 uncharacterized protein LOC106170437 [Lingula anatina]